MKGIGLIGAGLCTAAATAPVFHDLDEVIAAPTAENKHPWWVKQVDESTMEVNWPEMKRWNEYDTMRGSSTRHLTDAGVIDQYGQLRTEGAQITKQGMTNSLPRLTLRDQAWGFSGMLNFRTKTTSGVHSIFQRSSFLGAQVAPTPESQGSAQMVGHQP